MTTIIITIPNITILTTINIIITLTTINIKYTLPFCKDTLTFIYLVNSEW